MNKYTIKHSEIGKKRAPLRTFDELAEILKVLPGQLTYAFAKASIKPPSPRIVAGRKRWYCLVEVKAWWAEIDGPTFAVSERREYMQAWLKKRADQSSVTAHAQ